MSASFKRGGWTSLLRAFPQTWRCPKLTQRLAQQVGRGWWLAAWSGSELGEAHIEFDRNATRQRSEATKYSGGDEGLEVEEEDGGFQGWYLGVYAGLALVQCVGIAGQTLAALLGALRAARELHDRMLWRVLRAPVCLFDTTPTGRILNRFAGDMQGIDREMQLGLLNLLKLAVKAVLVASPLRVFSSPCAAPTSHAFWMLEPGRCHCCCHGSVDVAGRSADDGVLRVGAADVSEGLRPNSQVPTQRIYCVVSSSDIGDAAALVRDAVAMIYVGMLLLGCWPIRGLRCSHTSPRRSTGIFREPHLF